jgi:hypothetical protein
MKTRILSTGGLLAGCLLFGSTLSACGAGQWGFARTYEPLDAEEPFFEQEREYAYTDVNTNPADFRDKTIAWFGVVRKITQTDDGKYRVEMSHRKHQERHLCEGESASSCRVTVHFKSSGSFSALLDVRAEDLQAGLDKLQPNSLVKVYGKVRCRENDEEQFECDYDDVGGVLLDGIYYRQWPRRHYASSKAAATMKR